MDNGASCAILRYVNEKLYDPIFYRVRSWFRSNRARVLEEFPYASRIGDIGLEEIGFKTVFVSEGDREGRISFDVVVVPEASVETIAADGDRDTQELNRILLKVSCTAKVDNGLQNFWIEDVDECSWKYKSDKPLDGDLVPIISSNDYDAKASQILGKYYPEALKAPAKIDPEKLAERMGFMVIDRRLSLDGSVFGQVFFEDTKEAVFYAEDGTAFEEPVAARTIVVDRRINRISSSGSENITIAHECVHAALHKTAFKFAKSFNKDIHCIQCEMMPDDEQRPMRSRTLLWIESQANAIAPHLLMPAEPFKTEADSIYGRLSKEPGFDPLDSMPEIIRELAGFFGVTVYSASKRLAEVGYQMAAGAMDWIGEEYVKPYGYQAGSLKAGETFSLSFEKCLESVSNNDELRVAVDLGRLRFCEGHLCVNDPKYLERRNDGRTRLTDYGRRHVDECCVKFACEGYFGVFAGGCVSLGLRTEASFCRQTWKAPLILKSAPDQSPYVRDKIATAEDIRIHCEEIQKVRETIYPLSSQKALAYLRKDLCHTTQEGLAASVGTTAKTVGRYEDEDDPVEHPNKRLLAAMCRCMDLDISVAEFFMEKAGCSLGNSSKEDLTLKQIIEMGSCYSIEEADRLMVDAGLGHLLPPPNGEKDDD
jgi:DNA-binding XRE family transcriptional regulator